MGPAGSWNCRFEELEKLYDPQNSTNYKIRKPFRLTGYWVWSSTKDDKEGSGSAWVFDFLNGKRDVGSMVFASNGRALCVRRSGK